MKLLIENQPWLLCTSRHSSVRAIWPRNTQLRPLYPMSTPRFLPDVSHQIRETFWNLQYAFQHKISSRSSLNVPFFFSFQGALLKVLLTLTSISIRVGIASYNATRICSPAGSTAFQRPVMRKSGVSCNAARSCSSMKWKTRGVRPWESPSFFTTRLMTALVVDWILPTTDEWGFIKLVLHREV
jgi:hypothetical protein